MGRTVTDRQITINMEKRAEYLRQLIERKKYDLRDVPSGTLYIEKRGKRIQYYNYDHSPRREGDYIRKSETELIARLAQKDYDGRILAEAQKELGAIEEYLRQTGSPKDERLDEIYSRMRIERQMLINPIELSDEEYVRQWKAVTYARKGFNEGDQEHYSRKGERVRSKSEGMIADALDAHGIPFRYEYPLQLKRMGIIHPDFYCLNVKKRKEICWEHLGRGDDPEYMSNSSVRINDYEESGYYLGDRLIVTLEASNLPLNHKVIEKKIQAYLL